MIYDVQFFIDKFSAIPEDHWCTAVFTDGDGKHCANGHCGRTNSMHMTVESAALVALFLPLHLTEHFGKKVIYDFDYYEGWKIAMINDGITDQYQQDTPKQRILAALYDIKKLQTKDIDTGAKRERIVYVAVPETIKEQASELIMQ